MKTVTYDIPNINCGHCVHTIQVEVADLEGVVSVESSSETKKATITFAPPVDEDSIVALLKEINYPPVGLS